jgi:hypothetical protein
MNRPGRPEIAEATIAESAGLVIGLVGGRTPETVAIEASADKIPPAELASDASL